MNKLCRIRGVPDCHDQSSQRNGQQELQFSLQQGGFLLLVQLCTLLGQFCEQLELHGGSHDEQSFEMRWRNDRAGPGKRQGRQ